MAAANAVVSGVGCRIIVLRAPQTSASFSSSSSSKRTSSYASREIHNSVSLHALPKGPNLSLPGRHHGEHKSKRLLFYRRTAGGVDRFRRWVPASVSSEDLDAIPAPGGKARDRHEGIALGGEREHLVAGGGDVVEGLASEGGAAESLDVAFSPSPPSSSSSGGAEPKRQRVEQMADRAINATIVLAAGTAVVTKLLTIDHDYWHGWTLYEILRYAPQHNWIAYEEALKTNPVLAKMMISGVVYALGDWIAQCYEGKPLFEFDRVRMFRSGLAGFTLHGSLSHYYYHFCETLFPFQDWWVVPAKVVFDQTAWSAIWNSIYFVVLGFLRFESPENILSELKSTFWPMLTAGWKLWPFAHLITYGVIPVEQRLLWVDCVELIWVTILSTYSNEKSEARSSEATSQTDRRSS